MNKLTIAYSDEYLNWKLGNGTGSHPTNAIRAKLATELIVKEHGDNVEIIEPTVFSYDRESLESIHDEAYVARVLDDGNSGEWYPDDTAMGQTALTMFAGTARLVEGMIRGDFTVGFNPQGAKHHAQFDTSSGFCVFNDMAWAAEEFGRQGEKVLYIDWDAHHGDGVENLLAGDLNLVTASIHDANIFPGTGHKSIPTSGIYNFPLETGAGDDEFKSRMDMIEALADELKPTMILLATGADAHITDPLSSLNFDYPGYEYAADTISRIAAKHSGGRVLIGGAGGYQPETHTPKVWATVVNRIYSNLI